MALEKLLHNPINARDFQQPAEARSMGNAKEKLDELKESPFCNHGYWIFSIDEHREEFDPGLTSRNQLLEILIQSQFNKQKSYEDYNKLKKTLFYDKKEKLWSVGHVSSQYTSQDQLLGILAEAQFDKNEAKNRYEAIKDYGFYTPSHKLWNDANQTEPQLFSILVESMFDKNEAKRKYEKLKETDFYDSTLEQWNFDVVRPNSGKTRTSANQLLGVLVEGLFDKEKARGKYEALKQTELYDREWEEWCEEMGENQKILYNPRNTQDQLLGILVEHMLEEPETDFAEKSIPVPEIRVF